MYAIRSYYARHDPTNPAGEDSAGAATGESCFLEPPPWRVADEDLGGIRRLSEEIRSLARAKNAVILAHNYQLPRVQEVSDVVGDSSYNFV